MIVYVITWAGSTEAPATLFNAAELADWIVNNLAQIDEIEHVAKWEFDPQTHQWEVT